MATTSQRIAEMEQRLNERQKKLDALAEQCGCPTSTDRVNITLEQIQILNDILEDFVESQGNATISQLRTWVRENDDLSPDEKTAIGSAVQELMDVAPEDWTVEGEFADWLDRRAEEAETVNVEIPLAGRTNRTVNAEIPADRSSGDTYTKEIPIQGGNADDPDTITVEYVNQGPSYEDVQEFEEKLERQRAEDSRRRKERANQRRQEQASEPVTVGVVNVDDLDTDDIDVPPAGRSNRDEE